MPKSKHLIPGRVRSACAFIKAHRDRNSVQMMCRVLEVAVSGYYDWLKQPLSNHTALGRFRERTFVTAPITYSAYRLVSSLLDGTKGYDHQ